MVILRKKSGVAILTGHSKDLGKKPILTKQQFEAYKKLNDRGFSELRDTISLDAPVGYDSDGLFLKDSIPSNQKDTDDEILAAKREESWNRALDRLKGRGPMRERDLWYEIAVARRAGVTLDEFASRNGMTRERVRQLEEKISDILRNDPEMLEMFAPQDFKKHIAACEEYLQQFGFDKDIISRWKFRGFPPFEELWIAVQMICRYAYPLCIAQAGGTSQKSDIEADGVANPGTKDLLDKRRFSGMLQDAHFGRIIGFCKRSRSYQQLMEQIDYHLAKRFPDYERLLPKQEKKGSSEHGPKQEQDCSQELAQPESGPTSNSNAEEAAEQA